VCAWRVWSQGGERESELARLQGKGDNKETHVMCRGVSILGNVQEGQDKCEINGLDKEEMLVTAPSASPE